MIKRLTLLHLALLHFALLLLTLTAFGGEQGKPRIYNGLEIYTKIKPGDVTMAPDGSVYILDKNNHKVLWFNPEGRRMDDFCRKGQGPGEVEWPDQIFFHNNALLVHDANRVSIFSPEGQFQSQLANGVFGLGELAPVQGGWLAGNRLFTTSWEEPGHLFLLNEKGAEEKVLLQWERTQKMNRPPVRKNGDTIILNFNPALEFHFLVVSPDGRHAWFRATGSRDIYLMDATKKAMKLFIQAPKPPQFNKDWAEKILEEEKTRRKSSPFKLAVERNYPKRFPAVRNLVLGYDGLLYLESWSRAPEKEFPLKAYNMRGEPSEPNIPAHHLRRILAWSKDKVCVSLWDAEEEEATVAVVSKSQAVVFMDQHPIKRVFSIYP